LFHFDLEAAAQGIVNERLRTMQKESAALKARQEKAAAEKVKQEESRKRFLAIAAMERYSSEEEST
jgi:hypothetical protein